MKPKQLFNNFAKAEAITWTLLIAGLIARAVTDLNPLVLTIVGSIHGAVFLGYGVVSALVGVNQRWKVGTILIGIFVAIVPYATIPFEIRQNMRSALEGAWRRTASSDPRDANWFDRLFRWFINRPLLLVLALLVVVAGIFGFLVWMGPPDTWAEKFN